MPRTRPKRKPWTRSDQAEFKRLAKQGLTGPKIAKKLKRSLKAIYQYASKHRIRFNSRRKRK